MVLACLVVVALAAAAPARAQAPSTVLLEDLTWTELRDRVRAGTTTIIVPIGGTEQNGPHMTLGKHNARVKALSERIARALGNALVAPVVAYVPEGGVEPPTAHMRFPGTITVPDAAFEKVLEYAARSFRRAGFRDVVLLGDHGGYQKDDQAVADRLNREWAATGGARARASPSTTRVTETELPAGAQAQGHTPTPRSGSTPVSPTPRSRWPSIRASSAWTRCAPAR